MIPRELRQLFYKYINPFYFKSAGAKIGSHFLARNRVYLKIYKDAELNIGNHFTLFSGESINPISKNIRACLFINKEGILHIGNNVGMSSTTIWCNKRIDIGNNVKIGALVTILDTDCHSLNYINRRENSQYDQNDTKSVPIDIGDDVLIGAHSIILKGVHIGARSIIGAGSVVTKDIPSDCIASGNPCKIIKYINNNQS